MALLVVGRVHNDLVIHLVETGSVGYLALHDAISLLLVGLLDLLFAGVVIVVVVIVVFFFIVGGGGRRQGGEIVVIVGAAARFGGPGGKIVIVIIIVIIIVFEVELVALVIVVAVVRFGFVRHGVYVVVRQINYYGICCALLAEVIKK
jgi:hypothetical protein